MVGHIPNVLTDTPWDARMEAPMPTPRPEAPGALVRGPESESDLHETWQSRDKGTCYVEIKASVPVAVQYSGTGLITYGQLRHLAETFVLAWIDIDADLVRVPAKNGVPTPCTLAPVQPTHRAVWAPLQGPPTVTLYRLEGAFAYGHVEWENRADPDCTPNFQLQGSRWWWISPDKKPYPTPANRPGQFRFEAL